MPTEPTLEELIASGGEELTSTDDKPTETETPSTETTETATETTAAVAETTEETAETPEPEATEEDGSEESDTGFIEYAKSEFGIDLSKYTDDREAIKGVLEASRKIGERDDDAAFGRSIRDMAAGREAELLAFLRGETPEKQAAKPKTGALREIEDFPEDADTWRSLLVQDEKGQLVPPPGANFTLADVQAHNSALARRISQMAREWSKVRELPQTVAQRQQATDAQLHQERTARAVSEWENQYKSVLYVNGQASSDAANLTPTGKKILEIRNTLLENNPNADLVKTLRVATDIALGQQTSLGKTTRKPPAKAVRTPAVAGNSTAQYRNEDEEIEKRIAKGDDLVTIMLDIQKKQGAKSVT